MKTLKTVLLLVTVFFSMTLLAQQKSFHVDIKGKGQPILLFPGFTCTGEVWEDLVKELSKTNECHIFTFAGFGDVPAIETPWLSKIKEGVVKYISENKLEKATLIGHSLGGTLALWLATDTNAEYHKIIVVDALPSTGALMVPNFDSSTIVYENPYNQQLLNMDEKSFEAMAAQMASVMVLNKTKHEQIKQWILNTDRQTYVYGYTDLIKLDLREAIAKIEVPVLLLSLIHI